MNFSPFFLSPSAFCPLPSAFLIPLYARCEIPSGIRTVRACLQPGDAGRDRSGVLPGASEVVHFGQPSGKSDTPAGEQIVDFPSKRQALQHLCRLSIPVSPFYVKVSKHLGNCMHSLIAAWKKWSIERGNLRQKGEECCVSSDKVDGMLQIL